MTRTARFRRAGGDGLLPLGRFEIEAIAAFVAALREAGADGLDRRTLGERVNCRLWGPRRFRHALAEARERGAIFHTGRGRFVAEQPVGAERG